MDPAPPVRVIVEVPKYYFVFLTHFYDSPPCIEDFQELLRQILNEMLNYPYEKVIQHVGFLIPDANLMRDKRLQQSAVSANHLTLATAEITAMLCNFFRSADLFDIDGTLPYTPHSVDQNVMVLRYVGSE